MSVIDTDLTFRCDQLVPLLTCTVCDRSVA